MLVLALASASPAFAGAWWHLSSRAAPTFLSQGGRATIVVAATNVGDAGVNALTAPVSIKDTLPPNLEATAIKGAPAYEKTEAQNMTCELKTLSCASQAETFPPFQTLDVTIEVNVKAGAGTGERNEMSVQGGEQEGQPGTSVPGAQGSEKLTVNDELVPFGVEEGGYTLTPEAEGGALDSEAGSHPFQLTTMLDLNQTTESVPGLGLVPSAPALPKNLSFNLPPGLIGDPRAVKPCPDIDFLALYIKSTNACKPESAIGVVVVTLDEPSNYHFVTRAVPLWNLEPAQGEPARFGFEVYDVPIVLDTSVRTGGDYGVTVSVSNATEAAQLLGSEVTIWGVPADSSHDQSRGWSCVEGGIWSNEQACEPQHQSQPSAFLTLPTSCTGPVATTVEGESWPFNAVGSEPGRISTLQGRASEYSLPTGMQHCERLPFKPSIGLESESHEASTPTGLKVDVHVPQQTSLEGEGLAEADVRSTTVTLPEGVELNPSAAEGLQACSEQQIGYEGPPSKDPLSEGAPQPLRFSSQPADCPDASKIGAVRVHAPLLEHELQGAVYLAAQDENPFGSLLALYIVAEDPYSGVRVKLAGEVKLSGETGQITSTFVNTPQLPFEDFELEFSGGPRAAISTPALCGRYGTSASFTPWSGTAPVEAFSESGFNLTSGPSGLPCTDPQPFAPAVAAGSANSQAGVFTAFTLQINRPDADQALSALSLRLPAGAAAMLASVTPCPEPQASEGTCGPQSEIGQATAVSGLGPDPYTVTGGRVYITGPYAGAPFGLSIVTPAVAGPFNLGNVVVRSAITIDPHTAQVTITSTLPTMVQGIGMPSSGIPLQLQRIYVTVDRPDFEFNPTSCEPKRIDGMLTGAQGATAPVAVPFQASNCAALPFKPTLIAGTQGRTSKLQGASLKVKVTSGPAQANIAKTVLTLPSTLPARLSTIQKACVAATFEANPAACPEGSVIGHAIVHTPVLRSPLTGPAYLVSHGGAAWPDVEFVLQGEGITLILDGQTAIRKDVTTSSFESVPDAPVSSFEAILPEGSHSALTTNLPAKDHYDLCGTSLSIPATLTGQNNAIVTQKTKIIVEGCHVVDSSRPRPLTRAQKLARALEACRKRYKRARAKRAVCEHNARRAYGAARTGHARHKHAKSKRAR